VTRQVGQQQQGEAERVGTASRERSGRGWRLLVGDVRERLAEHPAGHFHCCVTSPPYYGLRDYGHAGQIGLEETPEAYVAEMVGVFREVRRVLRDDGTLWLNIGDSYAGAGPSGASYQSETTKRRAAGDGTDGSFRVSKRLAERGLDYAKKKPVPPNGYKSKDLLGIPWMLAFALRADGWYLRSEIIWGKRSPMPESVRDRPTKAHEQIFLLTKSPSYFYDAEAVKEPSIHAGSTGCVSGSKTAARAAANGRQPSGNERPDAGRLPVPDKRNLRSVWWLSNEPYAGAHFATFPTEIPKRAILAGTSAVGCCPDCGAPWRRVTERTRSFESGSGRSGNGIAGKQAAVHGGGETGDVRRGPVVSSVTLGWQPSCGCGHPRSAVVPCRVLETFAGSGTTLAVARDLGRYAVGHELNPEYAELAERRISGPRETAPAAAPLAGQRDLFSLSEPRP
jgi:DNA modification methylase